MCESALLLSGSRRRRLTGVFSYSSDDVFRLPIAVRIPRDDFAVFADENRRERMSEGFVVAGGDANVEELRDRGKIFFRWSNEVPVQKFFVGVVAGVRTAVAAKHLRCVVGRIEADGDEMSLFVERRIGGKSFVDVGEVAAHARAEVRKLATSVDEGEENNLALELIEVDDAIALVKEVEVGDGVARSGNVIRDCGLIVGARLGDDHDVVELDVGEVVTNLVCVDRRSNAIAGMEFAGDAGVFELVVHRHRFHEAGDVLSVKGYATVTRRDHLASYGERFLLS